MFVSPLKRTHQRRVASRSAAQASMLSSTVSTYAFVMRTSNLQQALHGFGKATLLWTAE
jgi:hypothetical protein